ncbi:MAG: hypothetical protein SFV15_23970 [Polyangiaceae bacterium]|nr:hypothetical protein [Polyangiaceae bacterium]
MESKFAQFLKENKIDPRRVVAASHELERLRLEDRMAKLQKRDSKKEGSAPAAGEDKKAVTKPRSGRGASLVLIARASTKGVTGPNKQRLLRAVNHILSQRKKSPVELKALF